VAHLNCDKASGFLPAKNYLDMDWNTPKILFFKNGVMYYYSPILP
jgi:hypothetical protein